MQRRGVMDIRTNKHHPPLALAVRVLKAVVCAVDSAKRSGAARRIARDTVRKLERLTAARIAVSDELDGAIGPDAAAAICIGYALLRSGELWAALGWELV